jgi:exopolyphosphatase/pppGpp-phosphohydrolase
MTERHLRTDPPTPDEIATAIRDIDAVIDRAIQTVDLGPVRTLVGLAGSVTTITAHLLGLAAYDPAAIHLSTATPAQVQAACAELTREGGDPVERAFELSDVVGDVGGPCCAGWRGGSRGRAAGCR